MTEIAKKKLDARRNLLLQRSAISEEVRSSWSQSICIRLSNWSRFFGFRSILLYHPHKGEPDILGILDASRSVGYDLSFFFPKVYPDKRLRFLEAQSTEHFESNMYGIMEPSKGYSWSPEMSPSLMCVPCVGITRTGYRLGYGGGYYDRFLEGVGSAVTTVGVAFSCFLVSDIPIQEHDAKLDYIVTENMLSRVE